MSAHGGLARARQAPRTAHAAAPDASCATVGNAARGLAVQETGPVDRHFLKDQCEVAIHRGQACTRVIRSERETEAAALASNPRAPRAIDRLLIRTSARPPGVDDAETVGVDAHAVLLVQAVVAACDGGHAGPSGLRVSVLRFSEARRSSCERVSELAPRSGHEMKGEDSGTTEWGKARTHLFEEVSIDGADAAQADEEDVDLCGVTACCGV